MQVAINLENLRTDLELADVTGKYVLHDYANGDREWLRANSLAQLAINPLRLINQQVPTAALTADDLVIIPLKIPTKPPRWVHFGSEPTVRSAIETPHEDEGYVANDVALYHRVDAERLTDPVLAELLEDYDDLAMPIAIFGLSKHYHGDWRTEDGQKEWFEHYIPGHREIRFPNSTLILGDSSQEHLRDYFSIAKDAWTTMTDLGAEAVEYTYKA
jgi:hypothetical protein